MGFVKFSPMDIFLGRASMKEQYWGCTSREVANTVKYFFVLSLSGLSTEIVPVISRQLFFFLIISLNIIF